MLGSECAEGAGLAGGARLGVGGALGADLEGVQGDGGGHLGAGLRVLLMLIGVAHRRRSLGRLRPCCWASAAGSAGAGLIRSGVLVLIRFCVTWFPQGEVLIARARSAAIGCTLLGRRAVLFVLGLALYAVLFPISDFERVSNFSSNFYILYICTLFGLGLGGLCAGRTAFTYLRARNPPFAARAFCLCGIATFTFPPFLSRLGSSWRGGNRALK